MWIQAWRCYTTGPHETRSHERLQGIHPLRVPRRVHDQEIVEFEPQGELPEPRDHFGVEGAAFTDNGALEWPAGRLPTNTAGGGMSEAYVHGFNLVLEGVRQVRGTSTSQVADATCCLVTSGEGVPTSALLLRR